MAHFSDSLEREVRLERMMPAEIQSALETTPWLYVPFGALEWHGVQNVIGLDSLKAHEQLVGLASRVGGLVHPAVYFGAGGGHGDWPASVMYDAETMEAITLRLLRGWEARGFKKAILLSGHYPNRQQYLDKAATAYASGGGTMAVLSIVENQAEGVDGDHAAACETSAMLHLHPELVAMDRLQGPPRDDLGAPGERTNWMGDEYRDHPCYGLVGEDPRSQASAGRGTAHTEALLAHLEAWLRDA